MPQELNPHAPSRGIEGSLRCLAESIGSSSILLFRLDKSTELHLMKTYPAGGTRSGWDGVVRLEELKNLIMQHIDEELRPRARDFFLTGHPFSTPQPKQELLGLFGCPESDVALIEIRFIPQDPEPDKVVPTKWYEPVGCLVVIWSSTPKQNTQICNYALRFATDVLWLYLRQQDYQKALPVLSRGGLK